MAFTIFADTWLWIASTDQSDAWRTEADEALRMAREAELLTTQEVLGEYLTYFSKRGMAARQSAHSLAIQLMNQERVLVLPQEPSTFDAALDLYSSRLDKGYSYVDCVSMVRMRERAITHVASGDAHFAQEGFTLVPG